MREIINSLSYLFCNASIYIKTTGVQMEVKVYIRQ